MYKIWYATNLVTKLKRQSLNSNRHSLFRLAFKNKLSVADTYFPVKNICTTRVVLL